MFCNSCGKSVNCTNLLCHSHVNLRAVALTGINC